MPPSEKDDEFQQKIADVENGGVDLSIHPTTHFQNTCSRDAPSIRPRIIGEFRTLSVHVTDTHEGRERQPNHSANIREVASLDWHLLDVREVCNRLGVSEIIGLDLPMVKKRLERDGENVITPPGGTWDTVKKLFWSAFGGFGLLLLTASVICFIAWKPLGNPNPSAANLALAIVLLVVILVQAIFNVWQDFSTSRTMASITRLLPVEVLVLRDGSISKQPNRMLVLGDIIQINMGSKVPADVRLIKVSPDLKFDRAILTGESKPLAASVDSTDMNFMESQNIALQGTLCTSGAGTAVCVGLGDKTVFGRIARQASADGPRKTTLEVEIFRFVLIIASLALLVALIIVILWAAWLRRDHPGFITVPMLLIDCVSVMVAFIPEGLPVCVTLSLKVIAGAMRRSNILCKSLSTVESLGAVNVIASDKTGTLTQNRMTVSNIYTQGSRCTMEEVVKDANLVKDLALIAGLCNSASFETDQGHIETRKVNGDATDCGLLRFSARIPEVSTLQKAWREIGALPFSSKNKFAAKIFVLDGTAEDKPPLRSGEYFNNDENALFLVKGAPDILLPRCTHFIKSTGQLATMDSEAVKEFTRVQEDFASRGERVLLLARSIKHVDNHPVKFMDKDVRDPVSFEEEDLLYMVGELTAVGLISLVDPPKPDAAETVRICRRAGIRFAMVTGDFAITAAAIARSIGIITTPPTQLKHFEDLIQSTDLASIPKYDCEREGLPTSLVLTGSDIMKMGPAQWKQAIAFDEIVFARTTPQQKLQIVRQFQEDGCTVAVTGDGVNDAPALKQADVGVAIAGGSEVAMEAADLVLLSDFSAIVTGIEYGRLCFENLRKSILYLLPAGSFSELMPVLLNVLFGLPQALSSIQMILICIVTDVLPALSLVHEKPEADLLLRKPRNPKTDHLVDWKLLLHAYSFLGVLESLTSMAGAFYFGFHRNGIPFSALWLKYEKIDVEPTTLAEATNRAQSIYFFNLITMQWFNLLATRTRRLSIFQQNPLWGKKTRNPWIFPAMLTALALGCFFSYIGVFQHVFLTRGVEVEFFFLPMAYGVVVLFIDETRKWWNRGHPRSILTRIAW